VGKCLSPHRQRGEEAIEQLRAERPDEAQLEQAEKAARGRLQAVVEAAYPNRGRGHYDFAKLFVERAVGLMNEGATLGYVLPANSLLLGGWGKLRELLFEGADLTAAQARNKGGWLFDDVDHRYSVVLLTRCLSVSAQSSATIWPGIANVAGMRGLGEDAALILSRETLESLSDSVVVPWLNASGDKAVFEAMRANPGLSSGEGWISAVHDARWDFRSSGPQRRFASADGGEGAWRVLMTRHVASFAIDQVPAFQQFVPKPEDLGNGVKVVEGRAVLGPDHPLIVFRHPSRNDDSRTMIATALPEEGFIHNKGYVHAFRHPPDTSTELLLALLGFLNTLTCDWWVRRFVDRHVTAPVANNVRLPSWTARDIAAAANLTATLLARRGVTRLAGGRVLAADKSDQSDIDLLAALELLAARGFDLTGRHMEMVLADFSDTGCTPELRTRILEEMS